MQSNGIESLRIAIAEWLNWCEISPEYDYTDLEGVQHYLLWGRMPGIAPERVCIPDYLADISATFLLETEIERRGLEDPYGAELIALISIQSPAHQTFALAHASALVRCQAAHNMIEKINEGVHQQA